MNTSLSTRYVNIEDLRRGARRRLPRAVFDYIDGGADREHTLVGNSRAYDDIIFRPRCAVAVTNYDMQTTVLGTEIAMPIILAPVGSSRMFYPRGEEVAATRRRIVRHDLHAVHAVGLPARGCEESDDRPGLVPAVSGRRPRCRPRDDRARTEGRLLGARRDDRYARRRHARTRPAQRHEGAGHAQSVKMLPFVIQFAVKPAGSWDSSATAA